MVNDTVVYSGKDHIAFITLNRPDDNNTITGEMARELTEICDRINGDEETYVVVLTGSGNTFSSGGEKDVTETYHPAAAVAGIERPVIAAINGDAAGLGLELALSCDIRIASDKAKFTLPQVIDGQIPTDGGTQRLPRIVGRGKALEMLMTGTTLSAQEALEIGLVSSIFPPGNLKAETDKLAETIAAKGPLALRYLKEAIIKGMDMTLEQGLRLEADLYFLLHTTSDRTEGIKSYLEKRKPEYKGK
jgi:enoyl-CoA hydratase